MNRIEENILTYNVHVMQSKREIRIAEHSVIHIPMTFPYYWVSGCLKPLKGGLAHILMSMGHKIKTDGDFFS